MKTVFQITLKSIKTLDNGMTHGDNELNLASFSLIYPREGVASVENVKKMKLENNKVYSFENEDFSDRLLFKESIQGDSSLKVKLAVVESVSKIDKILTDVFKGALLAGAGLITGGTGTTLFIGGAKKIIESVFDTKELKDKIIQLGEIEFPINETTKEGDLILNLSVKKKIIIISERTNTDGEREEIKRTLSEGFGIAQVVLTIKKVNIAFPNYVENIQA